MESNNIVLFPKKNENQETIIIPSQEQVQHDIEMIKYFHIQEVISVLGPMVFNYLQVGGFNMVENGGDDIKDGAFIIESIRSFMCKKYGLYHPFQQIAEGVFTPDDKELNSYIIADSLNINLKENEQGDIGRS